MPPLQDNAICIRHWDFSETSQTVSVLTREHGIIRGLAKGSRREKGSFSGGIDVLTQGHLVAIVKPGRDLATLTQWSLQRVYMRLRTSLAANRTAWFMADLVHHMLTDHDPHPLAYDGLAGGLLALDEGADPVSVLLRFQWSLLRETGYEPHLENMGDDPDAPTLAFTPSTGRVGPDTGEPGQWRSRRSTIELLRDLGQGESIDAAPPETRERASRLLATYFRELIGYEPHAMKYVFGEATERRSDGATKGVRGDR